MRASALGALFAVAMACLVHASAGRRGASMSTQGTFQTRLGAQGRGNRAGLSRRFIRGL